MKEAAGIEPHQGDGKTQAGRAVTCYRLDFTLVCSPAPSRVVPSGSA